MRVNFNAYQYIHYPWLFLTTCLHSFFFLVRTISNEYFNFMIFEAIVMKKYQGKKAKKNSSLPVKALVSLRGLVHLLRIRRWIRYRGSDNAKPRGFVLPTWRFYSGFSTRYRFYKWCYACFYSTRFTRLLFFACHVRLYLLEVRNDIFSFKQLDYFVVTHMRRLDISDSDTPLHYVYCIKCLGRLHYFRNLLL